MFLPILLILAIVSFLFWFLWQMAYVLIVPFASWPDAPFVPTGAKYYEKIVEALGLKSGERFYDLGCGHAGLLIYSAQKRGTLGIGYEMFFWPRLLAQSNAMLRRTAVNICSQNLLSADLSDADAIYCYLSPLLMKQVEDNLLAKMKSGSRVLSRSFPLPSRKPDRVWSEKASADKFYLYYF